MSESSAGSPWTVSFSVNNEADSDFIREAILFEERLRADPGAACPAELDHTRIASVLKLLNSVMVPGSTCSLSTTSDEAPKIEVPSRVGRFSIGDMVGRGGFGAVFKAQDSLLHRVVALKAVPRRASLETNGEDFRLREARAAARLNHPSLVPLYEVLEDDQYMYLVSEFCDGPTLAQYLHQNHGPLRPAWAVEITLKLAQAIAHAHGRGLVHRDIKPSNVILVTEHADVDLLPFTPRLTDFGLVLDAENESLGGPTASGLRGRLVGTTLYMAPEQLMGDPNADARAGDVYALGLLLYQMLANSLPYDAKSPMGICQQICSVPIPKITNNRYPISSDLRAIYLRALAKKPADRYATAQSLVDDLARLQDGREVAARPLSNLDRAGRVIRRAPLLSASLLALFVLIVASTVVFAWNNRTLRQQQVALERAVQEASISRQDAIEIAYRSDMNQAYLAIARQDPATAMSFANQIQNYSSDEYHDRFDFRLLRTIAQTGWSELTGFDALIEEIEPMPKSNLYAVAGGNRVCLYRADELDPIREIEMADGEVVHALAVSPDEDRLAIGVSAGESVWSWLGFNQDRIEFISLSGQVVPPSIQGFKSTLESLAWSEDGKYLAAGTRYEPLQVFTVGTDDEPLVVQSDRRNEDVVFGRNNELAFLETKTELRIQSLDDSLLGKNAGGRSLSLPKECLCRRMHRTPDGRRMVASLRLENRVCVYDTRGDEVEPMMLESHHGEAVALRISPSGEYVAGGTNGGGVVQWRLDPLDDDANDIKRTSDISETHVGAKERHHSVHGGTVTAICVNDVGTIVSGGEDGSLAVWTPDQESDIRQTLSIDDQSFCADISPDGKTAVVGCFDGSVWRVDLSTGLRNEIRPVVNCSATAVTISADGQYVVLGFADGSLAISRMIAQPVWFTVDSQPMDDASFQNVNEIRFNVSGNQICLCRAMSLFELFEIVDEDPSDPIVRLERLTAYHAPTSIEAISVLDDASMLVLGDTIRFWNPQSTTVPTSRLGIRHVHCQVEDVDQRQIYVGCGDGRIRRLDASGSVLATSSRWAPIVRQPEVTRRITAITLSPDRKSILTGSDLGDVAIWDAASLRYLGSVWPGDSTGEIQHLRVGKDDAGTGDELLFAHQCVSPAYGPKTSGKLHYIRLHSPSSHLYLHKSLQRNSPSVGRVAEELATTRGGLASKSGSDLPPSYSVPETSYRGFDRSEGAQSR